MHRLSRSFSKLGLLLLAVICIACEDSSVASRGANEAGGESLERTGGDIASTNPMERVDSGSPSPGGSNTAIGGRRSNGGNPSNSVDFGSDRGVPSVDGGIDAGGTRDAWMATDSGQLELTDGSVLVEEGDRRFVCSPIRCEDKVLQCGDCIDNDEDGHTDWFDPECLGPCDNTEGPGLSSGVGGETRATCRLDCYFDFGNGPGNDDCRWDHRCDPLEPERAMCPYQADKVGTRSCPIQQSDRCEDKCLAITPNGCDCFGCCTFPALAQAGPNGTRAHVWIGHMNDRNESTCTLDGLLNEQACPRCTPVDACNNRCGECEICVGKPTVPDYCHNRDSMMDGGVSDAGRNDAGANPIGPADAGLNEARCPEGIVPCGLPGDPLCAVGTYCLTGCCVNASLQ